MRKAAVAGLVVAAASAVLLAVAAGSPSDGARPVPPTTQFQQKGFPAAGRAALGRRVLVLSADPGKPRVASILESGRAAEGWTLFPAAPAASPSFSATADALATAAGAAWDRDRGFPPDVARALEVFAVKAVLVDDAGKGAKPVTVLERAEPVLRLDGDVPAPAADPVAFAAALRTTPARESEGWTWSDWEDALWGGAVTVETSRPARFLLPYPGEGAKVLVGGAVARAGSAGPLLVVDLPAGRSRVEVSFGDPGRSRWVAIGGGAGLVAGLVIALLAFRPSRRELEARAEARGG